VKVSLNREALKFAGGAIIVAAAVCVMLPDLVRYVAGLGRLGIWIVGVLILAWLMASVKVHLGTRLCPTTSKDNDSQTEKTALADDESQSTSS
jgi:hypothetical protein